MKIVYGKKKNIHPILLLATQTEHKLVDTQADILQNMLIEQDEREDDHPKENGKEVESVSNMKPQNDSKRKSIATKRKTVLENMREDKLKYQKTRIEF